MSSIRTFIAALKTGQTETTKALDRAFEPKRSQGDDLVRMLRRRRAFDAPLQPEFRDVLRSAGLRDAAIRECIDRWPDGQKEQARRAIIAARRDGRPVRFAWGLTTADDFETRIERPRSGAVTITALSPRASLRIYDRDQVNVGPVRIARASKAAPRRGYARQARKR